MAVPYRPLVSSVPPDVRPRRRRIGIPDRAPGSTPIRVRRPAAPPDWLAPLTEAQLERQASGMVNAQVNPVLANVRKLFADRSATGDAAITGYTKALAGDLGQYMERARQTYGSAEQAQADVNAATSSELHGGGSAVARALSSRLGAAGLDPAMIASLSDTASTTGAGAAGAQYASGSAELSKLLGEGAHAQEYAGQLPRIAALAGLQKTKDFQTQLGDELNQQAGSITSSVPSSIATLLAQLRNNEVQKQTARDSGLLTTRKANQDATYRSRQQNLEQQRIDIQHANHDLAQQKLTISNQHDRRAFNAQVAKGRRPNAALSRVYGFVVDGTGKPILNAQGKKIRVAKSASTGGLNGPDPTLNR